MASDVNFSVISALSDLSPARRAEPKAADPASASAHENADAGNASFDRLVTDQAATARAAAQARTRSASQRAERAMPGRVAQPEHREAPERPALAEKKNPEKPGAEKQDAREPAAQAERPQPDGAASHERAACAGPAEEAQSDTSVAEGETKSPDGQSSEHIICAGVAPEPQPEISVGDMVFAGPLSDAGLLEGGPSADALPPDGTLPGMVAAPQTPVTADAISGPTPADPAAVVTAGIAAITAKTGEATKTAETTVAPDEAEPSEAPDLAGLNLPKTSGEAQAKAAAEAGKSASTDGKTSGITKSETGEKAEGVASKSTVPNLHPSRASHFADILEGFGGSNSVHRPVDILAGLDRSVAAQALNRSVDVSRPTPLQMLPIEIGMQAVRGVTNFQIRLDPAELGRVDVKLQIRENGEVNASLVVDRVETLQMLRRDASTLQNAFEQAGLKQSPDGLSFSLRGEGQQGQQQEGRQQGGTSDNPDDIALQAQIGDAVMRRVLVPNSSIDRMV